MAAGLPLDAGRMQDDAEESGDTAMSIVDGGYVMRAAL